MISQTQLTNLNLGTRHALNTRYIFPKLRMNLLINLSARISNIHWSSCSVHGYRETLGSKNTVSKEIGPTRQAPPMLEPGNPQAWAILVMMAGIRTLHMQLSVSPLATRRKVAVCGHLSLLLSISPGILILQIPCEWGTRFSSYGDNCYGEDYRRETCVW